MLKIIKHIVSNKPKESAALSFGLAAFLVVTPNPLPSFLVHLTLAGVVAAGVHSSLQAIEMAIRQNPKRPLSIEEYYIDTPPPP